MQVMEKALFLPYFHELEHLSFLLGQKQQIRKVKFPWTQIFLCYSDLFYGLNSVNFYLQVYQDKYGPTKAFLHNSVQEVGRILPGSQPTYPFSSFTGGTNCPYPQANAHTYLTWAVPRAPLNLKQEEVREFCSYTRGLSSQPVIPAVIWSCCGAPHNEASKGAPDV